MYTLEELKQILKDNYDPDELIEMFRTTSDSLVEAYSDVVEEEYERFINVVNSRDIIIHYSSEAEDY